MKGFAKIALLVLLVLPIWLTIVALADVVSETKPEVVTASEVWKDFLNRRIPSFDNRRIQIVDLVVKNLPSRAPETETTVVVDIPDPRESGFSSVVLKFMNDLGRVERTQRLQAKLFIEERVPVAQRRFDRGQKIELSDIDWQWKEASRVADDFLSLVQMTNRVARSPIQAGEIITSSRTALETLVQKGDRVTILVTGEGLKISGVGVADQSGSLGQSIKVRNLDSKREIVGTITDEKVVEVRL